MRLPRFISERTRKGENPASNAGRHFDDLSQILGKWANVLEEKLAGLALLQREQAASIPPAILGKGKVYDVRSFASLAKAVSHIGSDTATLYITKLVTISSATTIPSNISVVPTIKDAFTVSTGVTLTINGPFQAGDQRVFVLNGTAAVRGLKYINAKWFCLGDGSTEDTTPFTRMCDCLQNAGGGWLHFPHGDYRLFGDSSGGTTTLGNFSALTGGIRITSDGATFTNTRTFADTEYGEIFRFTGCYNIEIGDFTLNTTTALPATAGAHKTRGVDFLSFYGNASQGGCKNIRIGNIKARGMRAIVLFNRTPSTQGISYSSRNIRIENIDTDTCAYGVNCQFSGDGLSARINSVQPHRSYFVYGVKDHEVWVNSQGQDANDALVNAYQGYGCQNIRVYYSNMDSTGTPAAQPAAPGCSLAFGDQTAAVHRHIRFHINAKWPSSGYFGAGLDVYKQDNTGAFDTTDRGHTIDGLEITGYFEGNPGPSNSPPITTNGSWGTGEFVRNVQIHDIRFNATASSTLGFLASLDGPCVLQNIYSSANLFIAENQEGTKITCINVRAPNLTGATSHAGYHDYIGCRITDGSTQSNINKNWIDCNYLGSIRTAPLQAGAGLQFATSSNALEGDLTSQQRIFLVKAMATGSAFRLRYHLVGDQSDTSAATRDETMGIKCFSAFLNSLGVWTIQLAVADEVTERTQGTASVLTVTLVDGDADGGFIEVSCTNYSGASASGAFVLEVLSKVKSPQVLAAS